jgi:hypothetical protein
VRLLLLGGLAVGALLLGWLGHGVPALAPTTRPHAPDKVNPTEPAARRQVPAPVKTVAASESALPAATTSGPVLAELAAANASFELRPRDPEWERAGADRARTASHFAQRLGVRVLQAECRGGLCRANLVREHEGCADRAPERSAGGGTSALFRFCEAGAWHSVAFFPDAAGETQEGKMP